MKPKKLKRSFRFKETVGKQSIVKVTKGRSAYDGVLFVGRVGISWDDWNELVKWVGKK